METTLTHLIDSLRETLQILKGPLRAELASSLHTSNLPDQKLFSLAQRAVDLLHETEQLLEPAPLVLADHFLGYLNCKCLCMAVEFNVPDILKPGPQTLETIAEKCAADPTRLRQVLRQLHNNGIFDFNRATDEFSNNAASSMLESDHWTQWRLWVELYGNEFYDMARGIPASCRKGEEKTAAQINYQTEANMFTYFTEQGWLPRLHKTLGAGANAQAPGILEDYPWEEVSDCDILDVGGATGALVALLLRKHKSMKAGILDLPKVIPHAILNFHSENAMYADIANRVPEKNLIGGDFTTSVPEREVYVMKWCLHDWGDDRAVQILKTIRGAIVRSPRSRLIVLETVLKEGRSSRLSRYADLNMMATIGGRERTEAEWHALATQTGWRVDHIYPLRNAWPCAIEFRPVWPTDGDERLDPEHGVAPQPQHENPNGLNVPVEQRAQAANLSGFDSQHQSSAATGQSNGSTHHTTVSSTMRFLEPWDKSRGNPFIRTGAPEGLQHMNFTWAEQPVTIEDVRERRTDFNLDQHGFCFLEDGEVSPELAAALRENDADTVKELYYPRVERLVKEHTGASRVIIFDHTSRKRRPALDKTANETGKEQPATMVHCDQSAKGAIRRLEQNIGPSESATELLKKRVQMLNIWRPLNVPVVDWPLAVMDYRSLDRDADVHACDLLHGKDEVRGQTVTFTHSKAQKWFYLRRHQPTEVTIIKIWDNRVGSGEGTADMCAHAAFEDPDTPLASPPRESIEARCLVLYD